MKIRLSMMALVAVLLVFSVLSAQVQKDKSYIVPTVVTAHYTNSEPESHGVVWVSSGEEKVTVTVQDLARGSGYDVVLLDESTGHRTKLGTFKTGRKGDASEEYIAKGLLQTHNALLILKGDDIIQYAQLQESSEGCICRHSGGSIVTQRLDQICYECPCGVNYEVCCGGRTK